MGRNLEFVHARSFPRSQRSWHKTKGLLGGIWKLAIILAAISSFGAQTLATNPSPFYLSPQWWLWVVIDDDSSLIDQTRLDQDLADLNALIAEDFTRLGSNQHLSVARVRAGNLPIRSFPDTLLVVQRISLRPSQGSIEAYSLVMTLSFPLASGSAFDGSYGGPVALLQEPTLHRTPTAPGGEELTAYALVEGLACDQLLRMYEEAFLTVPPSVARWCETEH